jgi:hypothetical protein
VAAGKRRLDDVSADELGASEDEELQRGVRLPRSLGR